ncbi:MAG: hypothetical protein QGF36_04475 [Candidatus Marinimicrobia bacterium]|jgi:hypothetical protein|nr:hypothetical protein [Candidatus Neomarinimicrobiota bacterium]MDP6853496.1 hypothetical protein [Candidatus Neomarinimicrobiota bacterium]MDP6936668.1 hypothetical protein [Candidatus Neomarinimicrobiota bacterium]|tara:strand:+ start:82 stop:300 length:219 start_codon:yes stop_codon:yes gene_type:complete
MIEFRKIDSVFNPNPGDSWKPVAKAAVIFFLVGYILYVLKEIIVGILSLICFGIGAYLLWIAFRLWRIKPPY